MRGMVIGSKTDCQVHTLAMTPCKSAVKANERTWVNSKQKGFGFSSWRPSILGIKFSQRDLSTVQQCGS
jgi:hypothetical protein